MLDASMKALFPIMPKYIDPSLLGLLVVVVWVTQAVVNGQIAATEQERYLERRRERIGKAEAGPGSSHGNIPTASLSDLRSDSAKSAWELVDKES